MENGLESLSALLRQKSIYETWYLCTTQFFWRSPEKYVFLTLSHSTILSISVLQWAQEASTYLYLGLTVSPTKICLLGSGGVIDGMFSFTSPPPHALLLWIEMPYSCPLLMGSYTVGETQRGQALSFLPQVFLYILTPHSALKKLVQEKCASGKVGSLLSVRFLPPGKAWLITVIRHAYI